MANYLAIVTYTAECLKGPIAGGGIARVEVARKVLASAGGSATSWISARGQIWLAGP